MNIVFIILGICFTGIVIFAFYETYIENKETFLLKKFNKIKKGDKYTITGVKNPFNISDKQVAIILDKDISPEDNKRYIQFICDNVKYSCVLEEFLKEWNEANNCCSIKNIEVDTSVGIKQKHFGKFDAETIRKK